jgi:hypothetical protein
VEPVRHEGEALRVAPGGGRKLEQLRGGPLRTRVITLPQQAGQLLQLEMPPLKEDLLEAVDQGGAGQHVGQQNRRTVLLLRGALRPDFPRARNTIRGAVRRPLP